jgi:hypothetical protein
MRFHKWDALDYILEIFNPLVSIPRLTKVLVFGKFDLRLAENLL